MCVCFYILLWDEQNQVHRRKELSSLAQVFWGAPWMELMPSVTSGLVLWRIVSHACPQIQPHSSVQSFLPFWNLPAPLPACPTPFQESLPSPSGFSSLLKVSVLGKGVRQLAKWDSRKSCSSSGSFSYANKVGVTSVKNNTLL